MTGIRRASLCSIAAFLLMASISEGAEPARPAFNGALFRSLFTLEPFRPADLDSAAFAAVSDILGKRITEYTNRRTGFRSRIQTPIPPPEFELKVLLEKRRGVERGIVSLASVSGIEEKAAGYARNARLYYEWEGQSDGPLGEARYAERFLDSPVLKPYLLLFLMHRYRCAYECFVVEKNTVGAKEASDTYKRYLKLARAHPDPLVGLMANDMDSVPGNIYQDTRFTGKNIHP